MEQRWKARFSKHLMQTQKIIKKDDKSLDENYNVSEEKDSKVEKLR